MSEVIVAIISGLFGVASVTLPVLIKNRRKEKKDEVMSLIYHPVFARLDVLKGSIENTFTLPNKGKEKVFKDIIGNQMRIFKECLLKLSECVESQHIKDNNHLYNSNVECVNEILGKLRSYYKNNPNYTCEEQRVMDIVMSKYESWNKAKIQLLEDNLMLICNSPFYDTVKSKCAVILDFYLGVAIDTINDASKALGTINGDLRGLIFKGVEI